MHHPHRLCRQVSARWPTAKRRHAPPPCPGAVRPDLSHDDGPAAQGHSLSKSQIILERPIKTIGMFEVKVALHPEVRVTVKANVARSDDEAELQAKGIDVIGQTAEDDRAEGEGFTEEFDPNAEPGELPVEEPAEGEDSAEG